MYKAFSQCLPHRLQARAHCKLDHWSSIKKGGLGFREGEVAGNSGLTIAEQMSPLFTHSRNGSAGPVNQVGMAPPVVEQQSGEGRRQPTCLHRLCAKCYQHRMLLLILPPDWVSLSPALPCPTPASPLPPSVCVATGKEEGRRRVSGGLGCVLGRPLLLLPPGQLGLSSQDQVLPPGALPPVTGINT